jgi:hypothetical protein
MFGYSSTLRSYLPMILKTGSRNAPLVSSVNHRLESSCGSLLKSYIIGSCGLKELREQRAAAISAGKKPTRIFRSTVLRTAKVDKNTLKEKYHSSSKADVGTFVTEMNGTEDKKQSSEIKAAERLPRDETKFLRDRNQALEHATFALEARIRFLEAQVRSFKARPLDEITV